MSIKLMALAWELELPHTEKMVLLCLCDHASDEGVCWPSVDTLARKCSVSDRTVQGAIKKLRNRGILSWDDAPGRPHRFSINPAKFVTPENASGGGENPSGTPENASGEPSKNHKEPSDISADADSISIEDFLDSWNEAAEALNLPKVRKLTRARKRAFEMRRKEYPDIEDWKAAFACLARSKFLHGSNDRGWKANIDFFLQASKFPKLVEGAYG